MTIWKEVVVTIVKSYAVELEGNESEEDICEIVCEDFFGGYDEMDIKPEIYTSTHDIESLKRHSDEILEL